MNKIKLIVGILVFGSLWGFVECIIGPIFSERGLPSGAFMTAIFAIGLMSISRMLFKKRGMQLGMGVIAGTLRLFNPFGGCVFCSAIAIAAEGFLFELIWYQISFNLQELQTPTMKVSMGILSSYICYVVGFITTQILTPLVSTSGFYLQNLIGFIPQILSRGLLAGIIGGITVPSIFLLKNIQIETVKDKVYYPIATVITLFCWIFVVSNWFVLLGT